LLVITYIFYALYDSTKYISIFLNTWEKIIGASSLYGWISREGIPYYFYFYFVFYFVFLFLNEASI